MPCVLGKEHGAAGRLYGLSDLRPPHHHRRNVSASQPILIGPYLIPRPFFFSSPDLDFFIDYFGTLNSFYVSFKFNTRWIRFNANERLNLLNLLDHSWMKIAMALFYCLLVLAYLSSVQTVYLWGFGLVLLAMERFK